MQIIVRSKKYEVEAIISCALIWNYCFFIPIPQMQQEILILYSLSLNQFYWVFYDVTSLINFDKTTNQLAIYH